MGPKPRWAAIGGAALAVGLVYLAIFAVPPLIAVLVDDLSLSHTQAGALMSVCLGGFLAGSIVSGRAVARFGTRRTVVAALVLCGVATLCLPLGSSYAVFLVCRVAVGIAGGLVYVLGWRWPFWVFGPAILVGAAAVWWLVGTLATERANGLRPIEGSSASCSATGASSPHAPRSSSRSSSPTGCSPGFRRISTRMRTSPRRRSA